MRVTKFNCDKCDKQLSSRYNLNRHLKYMHGESSPIVCEICSRKFNRPDIFNIHVRLHRTKGYSVQRNLFKCPVCFSDVTKHEISDHLLKHDITLKSYTKEFCDMKEFQKWKENFEETEKIRYVKPGKTTKRVDGSLVHHYICHRSGYYNKKGKDKRRLKSSGSNKLNCHCPSEIRAVEACEGKVTAYITETHVGHEIDIGRLPISKSIKDDIADKIACNIPFDKILDDCRDKVDHSLQRRSLITKKDLHNIAFAYKLKREAVRHDNDFISVPNSPVDVCSTEDNENEGMALNKNDKKEEHINTVCSELKSGENELNLDERILLIKLCCERIVGSIQNKEQATYLERTLLPLEGVVSAMRTPSKEGIPKLKQDNSKKRNVERLKNKSKGTARKKKAKAENEENLSLTISSEGIFLS